MTRKSEAPNAAVVGAGLGGLASAIRLASKGFQVTVFEKNPAVGGKAGSLYLDWEGKKFRFDTGPSLVTMLNQFEDLFTHVGRTISDYIEFKRLNVSANYYFENGKVLRLFSDKAARNSEIERVLGAKAAKEFLNYLIQSNKLYNRGAEIFLDHSPVRAATYLKPKIIVKLPQLLLLDSFRSMHSANLAKLSSPELVQICDRLATYNGSNPYLAPATFNLIAEVEFNQPSYYPTKGIYEIPKELERLCLELGVRFEFERDQRDYTSLCHDYDVVISNVDKVAVESGAGERDPAKYSTSCVVFYWGVQGIHHELDIHNILFSRDYEQEFKQITIEGLTPTDPTIYINITSKYHAADAPKDCENWFVMVNVANTGLQSEPLDLEELRKRVIAKISKLTGIEIASKIVAESVLTPTGIAGRDGAKYGSLYGLASNGALAAFARPTNWSNRHPNLFFAGGSVHPGGGMPLSLASAKIATDLAKEYLNR